MKNLALKNNVESDPMSKTEFVQELRNIGKERYHDNCKFHHLLHSGKLNKGQVQAWALNRYYYQINISIKDSALMSRIKNPELRRVWIKRILAGVWGPTAPHPWYGQSVFQNRFFFA